MPLKNERMMERPLNTMPSTSLEHQLIQNDSPSPVILCSRSTSTLSDNDLKYNFQSVPNVSNGVYSALNDKSSCASTINSSEFADSTANTSASHMVQFGAYVTHRLRILPNDRLRRKLENSILTSILDIEKESF